MKSIWYFCIVSLLLFPVFSLADSTDEFSPNAAAFSIEEDSLQAVDDENNEKLRAANRLKLTKHSYGKRNRIALAAGMMAFLAIVMTTAQQWNPD
ncbi:MAG TPA: hypothetical protein VKY57_04065 [Chitinispirillaceae bacterium]|nr:hypothetical protein [Chitinispirillaceae bacterium]